jgi:hypothetical protein
VRCPNLRSISCASAIALLAYLTACDAQNTGDDEDDAASDDSSADESEEEDASSSNPDGTPSDASEEASEDSTSAETSQSGESESTQDEDESDESATEETTEPDESDDSSSATGTGDESSDPDSSDDSEEINCEDLGDGATGGEIGEIVVPFTMTAHDGSTVTLHEACNQVVVVVAGAMWCPVCQSNAGDLASWQESLAAENFLGLYVLWGNDDSQPPSMSDLVAWQMKYNLSGPVLLGPDREWVDALFGGSEASGGVVLLQRGMKIAKKNTVHGGGDDIDLDAIKAVLAE